MKKIHDRSELLDLKEELGVRPDWHEPDEQDLTATVHGVSFDNAGFWPREDHPGLSDEAQEVHVILWKSAVDEHGRRYVTERIAAVNLATLFAWATGHKSNEHEMFERGYKTGYRHGREEGMNRDTRADALREAAQMLEARAARVQVEGTV